MAGWEIEPRLRRLGQALLLAASVTLAALWLPLPIPYHMDFSMLYGAALGLRYGLGIYDRAAQLALLHARLGPDVQLPFFVYPPWYAWTTAFLGWFPAYAAARLWFFLSLGMIVGGAWLLQPEGRPSFSRSWRAGLSFFWLPALGALVVGQYAPPVLFGLGVFLHGWRRERPPLIALGLLLLTFKPHLGLFPWLAALGLFWRERRHPFVRAAFRWTAGGLAALAAVSFLVQPDWPLAYWQALGGFQAQETFGLCQYCAGAGIYLARWWTGAPRMDWAVRICLGLAIGLGVGMWRRRRAAARWPAERWLSFSVLAGLLVNPYVMNYDYLLLLLPLWLRERRAWEVGLAFGGYWLAVIGGRTGINLFSIALTLVLLAEHGLREMDETL